MRPWRRRFRAVALIARVMPELLLASVTEARHELREDFGLDERWVQQLSAMGGAR
ncbi:MAG TPA: hypothetical protein VHV49_19245 [Pseudonocardiaceae bacterium]|nr:hypothetical protein [Pseudonocardiaceae bacterium]